MNPTEDQVVAWLRQLPDKRFFEVLHSAAEGRGPDKNDLTWSESHVVVGRAFREKGETKWSTELVGLPVQREPWADDEVVAQEGTHCGVLVVSWAKSFLCPVCGEATHGT